MIVMKVLLLINLLIIPAVLTYCWITPEIYSPGMIFFSALGLYVWVDTLKTLIEKINE